MSKGVVVFDNDDTNIPLRRKGSESILEKTYAEFQMYSWINLSISKKIVKEAHIKFKEMFKNNLLNFRDCLMSGRSVFIYSNGPAQWFYCALFTFMQLSNLRKYLPGVKIVGVRISKTVKLIPDLNIQSPEESVNHRLAHLGVLKSKLVDDVITGMPKKLEPNTIYIMCKPADCSKMALIDIFQRYKLPVLCIDDSKDNLKKFKDCGYDTLDCCLRTKDLTNKTSSDTRKHLLKWLSEH